MTSLPWLTVLWLVPAVGAIAVDPNDDRSVWVGGGETNPRNDVIPEGGLYHSADGGRFARAHRRRA